MMKYIDIKREGHICWVYIDRKEAMNALSTDVLKEITEVNLSLNDDLESRVVIYAGKGDHFSAGADLKEKQKPMSKLEAWRKNYGKPAIYSFFEVNQITIAAIDGYCLGGAACIVSACDFRIASDNALLGYPEINLGINLNWFGLPLAVRLVGPAKAKKMVIGGENENAETFFRHFHSKYCNIQFANSDNSLYCKYCHEAISTQKESSFEGFMREGGVIQLREQIEEDKIMQNIDFFKVYIITVIYL